MKHPRYHADAWLALVVRWLGTGILLLGIGAAYCVFLLVFLALVGGPP